MTVSQHAPPEGRRAPAGQPVDPWRPRTQVELVLQQVAAVERFNRARHVLEQAESAAAGSREMRMDTARRLEVLRRQHDAVVARAQDSLAHSGDVLRTTAPRTAVLAHRNAWYVDRLSGVFTDRGVVVVGALDNGADAVGLAVAEQPDLLLVEDTLAMLPGEDVVREVLRWSPRTRVVAQVPYSDRVGALLEAGATAVYTRQVPPVDVASAMCAMVAA